jgi:hypothetical protein
MNYIDLLSHFDQGVCVYDHLDSDCILVKNLINFKELIIEIQDNYLDTDIWYFCYQLSIELPIGISSSNFDGLSNFLDKLMPDDC